MGRMADSRQTTDTLIDLSVASAYLRCTDLLQEDNDNIFQPSHEDLTNTRHERHIQTLPRTVNHAPHVSRHQEKMHHHWQLQSITGPPIRDIIEASFGKY